jgi:hypothetical protein
VKKYKVKGIEVQDNSISPYGTDIESELTKILSEELAKSIDRELIKNLQRLSKPLLRQRKIKKIFNDETREI